MSVASREREKIRNAAKGRSIRYHPNEGAPLVGIGHDEVGALVRYKCFQRGIVEITKYLSRP